MVQIRCDKCGAEHMIPEQYQGKKVKCARCAHIFRAPESFGFWRDVLTSAVQEFGDKSTPAPGSGSTGVVSHG